MFELVLQRAQRSLDVEGCFDITQLEWTPCLTHFHEKHRYKANQKQFGLSPQLYEQRVYCILLLLSILITQT